MPPAVAAAGIGAAASIGGSVLVGKSAKKAANKVSDAQLQAQQESNALQSRIYDENTGNISPWMDRGNDAGREINALLGLDGQNAQGAAYGRFRGSPDYGFRIKESQDAINTGYAAKGMLQSGAALKALDERRQNLASAEYGNYFNRLSGVSGQGLTGANALAGVGTNYANAVSGNNQNAADARSNAAIASGNATGQMYSGIASAAGNALGSARGSSYGFGGPSYGPVSTPPYYPGPQWV